MPRYVALLRAVNVGGTGKLPMADLKALCIDTGFAEVETYIASGNVVFTSAAKADVAKAKLEKALHTYAKKAGRRHHPDRGRARGHPQAESIRQGEPNYTSIIFLDAKPPRDALDKATGRTNEKMQLGKQEIFVFYPDGMGRSKLKIPAAKTGTARN